MTEERDQLAIALQTKFDSIPPEMRVQAFGVDYGHVCPPAGGNLHVTRYGWPFLELLLPSNWYTDRQYAKEGERLPGSTGRAYHVVTRSVSGKSLDLVVKFSRVGQDVPLVVETTFPEDISPETVAAARFNSPMEEFGLVMELRRAAFGPKRPCVMAQRPLAIYDPPEEFELWQLGRDKGRFRTHTRLLSADQEDAVKAIELDIKRMYVVLYGWIRGKDAQECFEAGIVSEEEFLSLVPRVIGELGDRGFRVLDNKPKHYILRQRSGDKQMMRHRNGQLVYGLVDFELLQRTREYQQQFKARQRERYWCLQSRGSAPVKRYLPSHLRQMTVFGVKYLYGHAPDGGRIWVVGEDPDLFDYFLPERWRRTPRVKLSSTNEVYRTCTRDNIHVVYRRSRVGVRPRVDPLLEQGNTIRKHGYNSPFEEVAIAGQLRQMGVSTTLPRAVFRTGHRSMKAIYLRDGRRFDNHTHFVTPEPELEPILNPAYDYYTIWDSFRGIGLTGYKDERKTAGLDLDRALEDGLLSQEEYDGVVETTLRRLCAIGLPGQQLDGQEWIVQPGETSGFRRTPDGEIEVLTSIEALSAHEFGLLDEESYREIVEGMAAKLGAVDCEDLNPIGKHLLLTTDPDGLFGTDENGKIVVTLCNFESVRGLYRPIR